MKRRDFMALVGGAAAWPLVARAQQPAMPRVGYVWIGERDTDVSGAGLRQGLADKGYVIGRNLVLEDRYAQGDFEKVPVLIAELHRVAALWNPDNPAIVKEVETLRTSARALGLGLTPFLGRPREIDGSFAEIASGGFDGLVATTDPSLEPLAPRVIAFAAELRLPALYPFSTAVQQGGLMSYSADFFAIWRRAANYVDRILKGDRPEDLPIEQATAVLLKINLKTAKALGLEIPPQLLARADEVIE